MKHEFTSEELHAYVLQWRGIEDPCLKCGGAGNRAYSSTATWRGGIGGQMITTDVCDACWGTGDRLKTGANLRRLRGEEEKRVAERAVTLLADSIGANFDTIKPHVVEIILALDKMSNKRGRDAWSEQTIIALRNVLARALGAPERKLT